MIAMIFVWGISAPVAYYLGGGHEVLMAAFAAGVCLIGAALALAVSHWLRGPVYGFAGILVSMALRIGLPLVVLAVIHLQDGLRSHTATVYYFLLFYLVALIIETSLSLLSNFR